MDKNSCRRTASHLVRSSRSLAICTSRTLSCELVMLSRSRPMRFTDEILASSEWASAAAASDFSWRAFLSSSISARILASSRYEVGSGAEAGSGEAATTTAKGSGAAAGGGELASFSGAAFATTAFATTASASLATASTDAATVATSAVASLTTSAMISLTSSSSLAERLSSTAAATGSGAGAAAASFFAAFSCVSAFGLLAPGFGATSLPKYSSRSPLEYAAPAPPAATSRANTGPTPNPPPPPLASPAPSAAGGVAAAVVPSAFDLDPKPLSCCAVRARFSADVAAAKARRELLLLLLVLPLGVRLPAKLRRIRPVRLDVTRRNMLYKKNKKIIIQILSIRIPGYDTIRAIDRSFGGC
mmetsp:Transcript_20024/g.46822  ORF Transcript_20024/g.46822 Transcript_20024/m.46822 type:complete len:360 (+) Transcript_20024:1191-2270(+)